MDFVLLLPISATGNFFVSRYELVDRGKSTFLHSSYTLHLYMTYTFLSKSAETEK